MAMLRKLKSAGDEIRREPESDGGQLLICSLQELPNVRYASKVAVTCLPGRRSPKVVYSHVDLYKMVERIATGLREIGVRPNTVCAIALPNSVEAIVYLLAVVWIGAVAAPIDIDLDMDDFLKVMRAVKAATIVSPLIDEDEAADDPLFQRMKKGAQELGLIEWHITRTTNEGVVLETHGRRAAEGAAWAGGASDCKADEKQTAVIVSSVVKDSTLALPLTHRNFVTGISIFCNSYQIGVEDSTILSYPWYNVDTLNSILATIYSGGHLLIPPKPLGPDESFIKACSEFKIDWFSGSPEFLTKLADNTLSGDMHLKFIRCVNDDLGKEKLRCFEDAFKTSILESYGSAETCGMVSSNTETIAKSGTKGKPVTDCVVQIFHDISLLPLDAGTKGLVGVSGNSVSAGYLNEDELNKKLKVQEKDLDGSQTTYFLTGDTGYMDADGYLVIKSCSAITNGRKQIFAYERFIPIEIEREAKKAAEAAAREEKEAADEKDRLERESLEQKIRLRREEEAERQRLEDEKAEHDKLKMEAAEEKLRLDQQVLTEKERLDHETGKEKERLEQEAAKEKERFEKEAQKEKERLEQEAAKEKMRLEKEAQNEKERLDQEATKEKERLEKEAQNEKERLEQKAAKEKERLDRPGQERTSKAELGKNYDGKEGFKGEEIQRPVNKNLEEWRRKRLKSTEKENIKNEKKLGEENYLCASKENGEFGRKMSQKMKLKRKKSNSENKSDVQVTAEWKKAVAERRLSEKNTGKDDSAKWKPMKPIPDEVRKHPRGRNSTGSYKIPLEELNCKGSRTGGVLPRRQTKNNEDGTKTISSQLDQIVASQRRLLTRKTKRDDLE